MKTNTNRRVALITGANRGTDLQTATNKLSRVTAKPYSQGKNGKFAIVLGQEPH
ncbi:MAG TPA: hypothetical protein VE860_01590 [Chthoniobacterales bacterium]|nr:hypothetical protein [Chthoniobacterales bacterium]